MPGGRIPAAILFSYSAYFTLSSTRCRSRCSRISVVRSDKVAVDETTNVLEDDEAAESTAEEETVVAYKVAAGQEEVPATG